MAVDAALARDIVDGIRDSYRLTKRYVRPDGTVVHGGPSVVGMRDDDGRIEYFIAQVVDITDQEQLRRGSSGSPRT